MPLISHHSTGFILLLVHLHLHAFLRILLLFLQLSSLLSPFSALLLNLLCPFCNVLLLLSSTIFLQLLDIFLLEQMVQVIGRTFQRCNCIPENEYSIWKISSTLREIYMTFQRISAKLSRLTLAATLCDSSSGSCTFRREKRHSFATRPSASVSMCFCLNSFASNTWAWLGTRTRSSLSCWYRNVKRPLEKQFKNIFSKNFKQCRNFLGQLEKWQIVFNFPSPDCPWIWPNQLANGRNPPLTLQKCDCAQREGVAVPMGFWVLLHLLFLLRLRMLFLFIVLLHFLLAAALAFFTLLCRFLSLLQMIGREQSIPTGPQFNQEKQLPKFAWTKCALLFINHKKTSCFGMDQIPHQICLALAEQILDGKFTGKSLRMVQHKPDNWGACIGHWDMGRDETSLFAEHIQQFVEQTDTVWWN